MNQAPERVLSRQQTSGFVGGFFIAVWDACPRPAGLTPPLPSSNTKLTRAAVTLIRVEKSRALSYRLYAGRIDRGIDLSGNVSRNTAAITWVSSNVGAPNFAAQPFVAQRQRSGLRRARGGPSGYPKKRVVSGSPVFRNTAFSFHRFSLKTFNCRTQGAAATRSPERLNPSVLICRTKAPKFPWPVQTWILMDPLAAQL